MPRPDPWPRVFPALVFVAALTFYAPRVCRDLALIGDSPELVAAAAQWGVPHASGYPLFTTMGRAVALLPIGTLAGRLNATSALLHALTAAIVAWTVRRATGSKPAAVAAALFFALSASVVKSSLYFEVFPLNDFFFAVLLALALGLARDPADPILPVSFAACAGLAAAHHQSIAFAAPALVVLALPSIRAMARANPSRLATAALAFVVTFAASYALVLFAAARNPQLSWGDVHDLRGLVRLFLRRDFGGPIGRRQPVAFEPLSRLAGFARLFGTSTGLALPLLAAFGAGAAWRGARREVLALGLAFLATGPLLAILMTFNQSSEEGVLALGERFVLLPHLPLSILAGLAVAWVDRNPCRWAPRAPPTAVAVAALAGVTLAPRAWRTNMSGNHHGSAFVHDVFDDLPADAMVLMSGDVFVQSADYACGVDHLCERRLVFAPGLLFLDWYRAELRRRFPELAGYDDVRSITQTHGILDGERHLRPLVVHPQVLQRDPEIANRFAFAPCGLLLCLFPRDAKSSQWTDDFLERARRLAAREGCRGCGMVRESYEWPSFERHVALAYDAALANHARFARDLGATDVANAIEGLREPGIPK